MTGQLISQDDTCVIKSVTLEIKEIDVQELLDVRGLLIDPLERNQKGEAVYNATNYIHDNCFICSGLSIQSYIGE
jgi:hypothetical protein